MTTRTTPFAAGTPCWVHLLTSDIDKSLAFYADLFGWESEGSRPEFGGYANATSDGHLVAGMVPNTPEMNNVDSWQTFISTDDIDASIEAAAAAGGTLVAPAMQVSDLGSMGVMLDPAGALFGLWQPGTHTGFEKYNEPGSVTWDELHSKSFAATTDFYTSVFGWSIEKTADTDDFRYYQGQIDGETVAGLMDAANTLPAEMPSHWAVYFAVADVDAAVARGLQGGASLVRAAQDTPFGRIAEVADPTGAAFTLHGPNLA